MDVIIFIFLRTHFVLAPLADVPPSEKGDQSPSHIKYVEEALKDHSKRVILDPDWSKIVDRMAHLPIPNFEPPVEDEKKAFYTERIDWTVTGLDEVPYAAIIYDDRGSVPEQKRFSLEEGRACGGVLLTQGKVLTPCACVLAWLNIKNRWEPNVQYNSKYGIGVDHSRGNPYAFNIFVVFNQIYFDPGVELTDTYPVTAEGDWHDSECYGALRLEREVPNEQYASQQAFAILRYHNQLNIVPPKEFLLPWPPKLLFEALGEEFGTAEAVGFGFDKRPNVKKHFYDDFKRELQIKETSVTVKLRDKCDDATAIKAAGFDTGGYWFPIELVCAYVSNRTNFELCKGLLGSVVVRDGIPYGIITVPIDCRQGRVIIRPFYHATYWMIEDKLSKDAEERTRDPIPWRKLPPSRYVAYDVLPPGEFINDKKKESANQGAFLSLSNLLLFLDIFFISTK